MGSKRDTSTGESLFDSRAYKPPAFNDFIGLPERVYPTSYKILEQGGDLLFYREADLAKGISRKQNAIHHKLVQTGEVEGSDCRITVLVVTGMSGGVGKTARTMTVYDHLTPRGPDAPEPVPATTEQVQDFITRWFFDRKGVR